MTFEDLKERLKERLSTVDASVSIELLDDWIMEARNTMSGYSNVYSSRIQGFLTGLYLGNFITITEKWELMNEIHDR